MSVFDDFQRLWMQRFPQSSLSDAWEQDVRASLERHKLKIGELSKELEQETLYVEYLERLLSDVEKYRESGGDPTTLFEAAGGGGGVGGAAASTSSVAGSSSSSSNGATADKDFVSTKHTHTFAIVIVVVVISIHIVIVILLQLHQQQQPQPLIILLTVTVSRRTALPAALLCCLDCALIATLLSLISSASSRSSCVDSSAARTYVGPQRIWLCAAQLQSVWDGGRVPHCQANSMKSSVS